MMKFTFILPLFLLVSSCNFKDSVSSNPVTYSGDTGHLPESNGNIIVTEPPELQTYPPEYSSFPSNESFRYFLVKFKGNNDRDLIVPKFVIGNKTESITVLGGVSTGNPGNLEIDLGAQNAIKLESFKIMSEATGAPSNFIIYGSNTSFSKDLVPQYDAVHLKKTRAHIWNAGEYTDFILTNVTCAENYSTNNLGVCVPIRHICSDYYPEFTNPANKRCSIKLDGEVIKCVPKTTDSACTEFAGDICNTVHAFFEHQENLVELFIEDTKLDTKICVR